jgi:hypothetical protein
MKEKIDFYIRISVHNNINSVQTFIYSGAYTTAQKPIIKLAGTKME